MLNELKIDELLEKVGSRYGVALAGAKRARQINEYTATLGLNDSLGIPGPQVHTQSQHPLTIAIEELRADKLEVTFKVPQGQDETEPEDNTPQPEMETTEADQDEADEVEVAEAEAGDSEGQGAA